MQADRRSRRRTSWSGRGTIVMGNARRAIDCDIRDVGAGARIELDADRLMPIEFDLVAAGVISFRARVVWRERTAVGVEFHCLQQPSDPRVLRLWRRA